MSYDTAITIFSPSGQLLQVEYALEAVKMGNCTVGLKTKEHVILAVEKKAFKKLQDPHAFRKISLVDHHVVAAFTGLNADARVVVNSARVEVQSYRLTYDETPTIDYVSRHVSSVMQRVTQTGGARPFGLSIMLAGIDSRGQPRLNQVDPSGTVTFFKANCIGKNSKFVNEFLEKQYKDGLSLEDGLKLVGQALANNIDHPKKNSDIVVVGADKVAFLTEDELAKLYDGLETE